MLVASALPHEDSAAIVQRMATVMKSATRYHLEYSTESELRGKRHRSSSSIREILAKDDGNRVRLEWDDPNESFAIASDGTTLWRAAGETALRRALRDGLR